MRVTPVSELHCPGMAVCFAHETYPGTKRPQPFHNCVNPFGDCPKCLTASCVSRPVLSYRCGVLKVLSLNGVENDGTPPPPVPRNLQCSTAEPGGGSCVRFSPKIRPRNQGAVLAQGGS